MAITRLVTVTSIAATELRASTYCHYVQVGEDGSVVNGPTVDFTIRKMSTAADPLTLIAGTKYMFQPLPPHTYLPNELLGYIECVSGTSTFFIDES